MLVSRVVVFVELVVVVVVVEKVMYAFHDRHRRRDRHLQLSDVDFDVEGRSVEGLCVNVPFGN